MSDSTSSKMDSLIARLHAPRERARAYLAPRKSNIRAAVPHYVPILNWLPSYPFAEARADVIAGITVWGVGIPTAMAYAGIAGVPPEAGLYAMLAAMTMYAIFGTSRHLKVTASSTMAVMSAAVIAPMAGGDANTYWSLTAALALVVGIMLLLAGIVHLGFIADFLSKPVVTGFVFGLAIVIAVGQLPKIFGVPSVSGNVVQQVVGLLFNLPETNLYTLLIGAGAIALIQILRRTRPWIPAGLVALGAGIVVSALLNLQQYGVSIVGTIPTGLPQFGLPVMGLFQLPFLIAGAAGIVFLAVGESLGSARAFAAKHHYNIDADQELIALGMANVGAAFSQGMTVDASLSTSANAEAAGAKTQLTGLVSAGLVLVTILLLAPLFKSLPNAVLAAVVINAVIALMDVPELRRYRKGRRSDFILALVALFGVVLSDVLTGLMLAVFLSLLMVLYRASRPYMARLGRVPGQRAAYGDLSRHPEYQEIEGLIIMRMDAPLFFANANVADKEIRAAIRKRAAPPKAILLDLAATADLDIASIDMLQDLIVDLRNQNIEFLFAEVRGAARDRLRRTGLIDVIGAEKIFLSVEDAVHNFLIRTTPMDAAPVADENVKTVPAPNAA